MWRFTKRAFSVILILAIMVMGICAVFAQKDGGKLLSVQTGSMAPHLKKGTLVKVTRVPATQLAVGDVVTYISPKNNKTTVTHRIVALPGPTTKGLVVTKGDANPVADVPFSPKYIVGRVDKSVPYAGNFIDFVHKPIGLALLIYVPALMVIINEVRILSVQFRKMKPYISGYVLLEYNENKLPAKKIAQVAIATPLALVIALLVVTPVGASLRSNSVVLANSSFIVEVPPPAHSCAHGGDSNHTVVEIGNSPGSNNSITVNNTSGQSATSGSASNSGNTSGGSATSGNASNTNCTNINIQVHN